MRKAHWHWHQYQVLTKRSERRLELSPRLEWAPHIWIGVSVENKNYVARIDDLRNCYDRKLRHLVPSANREAFA